MVKRSCAALVTAALLAVLGIAPVFASTHSGNAAVATVTVAPARAECTGYMTASPSTQTLQVNQTANITAYWYCEGNVHVVANIDWKDGSSDNYTCWANCVQGQHTFSHVYVTRGTRSPHLWMNGSASGAFTVTVIVN